MKIELCSSSIEALSLANEFKFDRVELCQSIELGGLTPSLGFQEFALSFNSFATHALIRCKAGGFIYSDLEKKIMLKDMENSVKLGIHGLVVGAINPKKEIDLAFITEIKSNFPNLELTFHRAFDDLKNPVNEIEKLIDLGFKRILTSGGKKTVLEGIETIQKLISKAKNRIDIMLGGGINAENISKIINLSKPDAIHFSGTEFKSADKESLFSEKILLPNREKIKGILNGIE
jgi:copper homeostasis protein